MYTISCSRYFPMVFSSNSEVFHVNPVCLAIFTVEIFSLFYLLLWKVQTSIYQEKNPYNYYYKTFKDDKFVKLLHEFFVSNEDC